MHNRQYTRCLANYNYVCRHAGAVEFGDRVHMNYEPRYRYQYMARPIATYM